ncbi:hypothetical protein [Pleurocapsa sp. CCALA 161]|nr:hypothetical protein [Pleurocapsa sp. CCALA 161]
MAFFLRTFEQFFSAWTTILVGLNSSQFDPPKKKQQVQPGLLLQCVCVR